MGRMTAAACAACIILALMPVPAAGATRTVQVEDNHFTPDRTRVPVGGTVRWRKSTRGVHNVSSTGGMFRSGGVTATAFVYERVFSAGRFPYRCELHGAAMAGVVRVRPRVTAGPEGLPFKVRWATAATNTGSSFTVDFRVDGGSWRRWTVTDRRARVFGRAGAPVKVRGGRSYAFRVRSRSSSGSSRYSPPGTFTP